MHTSGAVERLLERAQGLNGALHEVGGLLAAKARESFAGAVSPYGQAWQPRSAATVEKRRREGKPLGWAHMASDVYVRIGETSAWVGAAFPFPRHFQEGNARQAPREFLPVRGGVVELPEAWLDEIDAVFRRHLDGE